jgi:aerobic-type carbon monoxide dehydrogenase small subunit (CoxS/CutS family)
MNESHVTVTVNGRVERRVVGSHVLLRDFVRDELGLTGTKGACEDGMCAGRSGRRP